MSYIDIGNPAYKKDYGDMECPECGGIGFGCDECDGTGYVPMTEQDFADKKESIREDRLQDER